MKKLLLSLTAITLVTSSAVTVVSCNYIDTVQVSVNNKINEVVKSTSHFFKPAILANVNGFSRGKVKSFLNAKKLTDIENGSSDTTTVRQQLNMFFNNSHLSEFEKNNFVNNENGDDFEGAEEESGSGNIIELISGAFNTIYGIIGEGFSPRLIETLFELIHFEQYQKQIISLNETLKAVDQFNPITKLKSDLEGVEIDYLTIKTYTLLNLIFFIDDSFSENGYVHEEAKELLSLKKFKAYAKKSFAKILNSKFNFKTSSIINLVQFFYGLGWYISAFDDYKVPYTEVVDDNHLFAKDMDNIEVFKKVNKENVVVGNLSLDLKGTFELLFAIFNSEQDDKESYEVSRILKLLFQVDGDTDMDEIQNPYKKKMNLGIMIIPPGIKASGTWGKYDDSYNGGGMLTPVISSLLQGIVSTIKIPIIKIDDSVSNSLGNLISSALANNNLSNFFIDLADNPGSLIDLINFIVKQLGVKIPIDDILKIIKTIGVSGALSNPFTEIFNGDILGQLIESITGNETKIRNIADLMNFKVFDIVKVGSALTTVFGILATTPDLIFKLKNALEKPSTMKTHKEYVFKDALGIEIPVGTYGLGDDPFDFELASKILVLPSWDGVTATNIKTKEEYLGSEFASMLLGISKNGTFIEGGILGEISKLWDGESGNVITTLMKTIKNFLESLKSTVPSDSNEKKYMKYLSASNFNLSVLDYTNFEDSTKESELIYEIAYKNIDDNSTKKYKVVLKLPERLNSFDEIKYEIVSFEII